MDCWAVVFSCLQTNDGRETEDAQLVMPLVHLTYFFIYDKKIEMVRN